MLDSKSSDTDINKFDLNSLHFAGFLENIPIAYFRITTATHQIFTPWTIEIAAKEKVQLAEASEEFPFEQYCNQTEWKKQFLKDLEGKKCGEAGKLAIHPDHRKNGEILDQLIPAFIHYCREIKEFDTAFGSCTLPLERYYKKFGFVRAAGSLPFIYKDLPEAVIMRFDRA